MFSKHRTRFSFLAALILSGCAVAHAQGFQVENKNPPAPATSKVDDTFTSLEGRFTVGLPQQISAFRGVTIDTPKGKVTVGDSYSWRVEGAQYEVGYIDKSKTPRATADSNELVRVISGESWRRPPPRKVRCLATASLRRRDSRGVRSGSNSHRCTSSTGWSRLKAGHEGRQGRLSALQRVLPHHHVLLSR
jgi:hypothetical protein